MLYGCTTWTLTKRLEKKLDGNFTRMLRAILNKFWWQQPTRYQLYGNLPPITKTIQVRRTRHAEHCWRCRDELITYIQHLCEDTGCSPEDLPEAMNNREKWLARVREILARGTTWYIYIYIYIVVIGWCLRFSLSLSLSLSLSCYPSQSFIVPGRTSWLKPISAQN